MLASAVAVGLGIPRMVWAAYPDRPIRVIVGFPAGGSTDVIMRVLAASAGRELGQTVIVENRPGGNSAISIVAAKNAAPDGYTLVLLATSAFSTPIQVNAAYDPISDLTYIIRLTNVQFGVVVKADSPFKTWQELVAYARRNPGKMFYGAPGGLGNTSHLAMAEIADKEKLNWAPVPYKGSADLSLALLGGQLDFAADGSGGFGPLVEAGKVRLLAMLSQKRSPRWPSVPTMRELGYDVSFDSPWGLGGPANMNKAVVQRIHDAFLKALDDAAVKERMDNAGQNRYYLDPADYSKYAVEEFRAQRALLTKYGFAKAE